MIVYPNRPYCVCMTYHGSRYARIYLTELLNSTSRVAITRHHRPAKVLVSLQDAELLEFLESTGQLDTAIQQMNSRKSP